MGGLRQAGPGPHPQDGFGLIFFESPPIGLDEFQRIGDQLERALLDSLVRFPFVMVQSPDDRDSGSLVEVFCGYFGQLLKTDHLDPPGFLLGGMEGQRERSYWIPFAAVKDFRIPPKVSREGALIKHRFHLLSFLDF
jgi:hypothetical protein